MTRTLSIESVFLVALVLAGPVPVLAQTGLAERSVFVTAEQARSSGPGHPWQGGPASVNPYSLAKQTSAPLVGWNALGGLPVTFALHHNSQAVAPNPALGSKWLHSYDTALLVAAGERGAAVLWGDHRVQMFRRESNAWVADDGYRAQLVSAGNGYALILKSQARLDFAPSPGPAVFPRRYRLASISDPHGNALTMQYNGAGRLASVNDPSGRTLLLQYAAGKLDAVLFVVGAMTRRWDLGRDGSGRLVEIAWPEVTTDSGPAAYATRFTYDASDNVASRTDREGNVWTYGYDGNRLAFEQWPANSVAQRMLYVRAGFVRQVEDPRGIRSEYEYDGLSRLVRSRDPGGNETTFSYADADHAFGASRVTKPSGDAYRYDYDARANVVGYTDPAGGRWDYTYDARDNRIQALEPLVTDAWGVTEPSRHRTEYGYDAANDLVLVREYLTAGYWYESSFAYDSYGRMTSFTDARGNVSLYQYDVHGNRTRLETPMQRVVRWVYDDAEATRGFTVPQARIDGLGARIELVRDEWGRLRVADFPSYVDHQYAYDGLDRLVRMQDGSGQTVWSYDANGRLVHSERGSWAVDHVYLPNGLLFHTTETAPAGPRDLDYAYDGLNRLVTLQDAGQSTQFLYDVDSRLLRRTHPNAARTEYVYASGRLAIARNRDGLGAVIASSSYGYQQNALVASVSEQDGSITRYGYDALNRIVREERTGPNAHSFLWSYDEAGNRLVQDRGGLLTTYAYDADNRLVHALPPAGGPELYLWNANGQLFERSRSNGTERHRFFYHEDDTLSAIHVLDGSVYVPSSMHAYDGLGRRWMRDGFTGGVPVVHSEFFHDGMDLVREHRIVQGQPSTTVMTWAGASLLGARDLLGGSVQWSATDGLGDLRRWTDSAGNASVFKATYNAFGEITYQQGQAPTYALAAEYGARSEGDAGMVCTGSGFYDPKLAMSLPSWAGACVSVLCAECGACPPNPHKPGCSVENPPPPPPGPLDAGPCDGDGAGVIDMPDLTTMLDAFAGSQDAPTFKLPPPPKDVPDEEITPTTPPPAPAPTTPPPPQETYADFQKRLREQREAAKLVFPPRRVLGVASGWKQR